jgi:hypothetical protein
VGPFVDSNDGRAMHGSVIGPTLFGGTVVSVSVYVDSVETAPNNQFQIAIYVAGLDGGPTLLVASSGPGTLTAHSWNALPLRATLIPGVSYWLGFSTNGNNNLHYAVAPVNWPLSLLSPSPKLYSMYATFQ